MNFSKKFMKDVEEAFEFWKAQQLLTSRVPLTDDQLEKKAEQLAIMPIEQWIAGLMSQQVYGILAQKRVANATEETETDAEG